jgi:hypothetical protein
MKICVVLTALAITGLGCSAPAQNLTEIYHADPDDKDGFVDISLGIESMSCDAEKSCTVRARGLYRGESVGLEFVLSQEDGKGERASYRSIGVESDRLLKALAALYKLPTPRHGFKSGLSAEAVRLGGSLGTFLTQRTEIKVFFAANGPQAEYAELYTNVDAVRCTLEINEKDSDYRHNVVEAFEQ